MVLSGDIRYSFVYDVELRGREGGPNIWQITSSGVRNALPARLLAVLDADGVRWRIREVLADGRTIAFARNEAASR